VSTPDSTSPDDPIERLIAHGVFEPAADGGLAPASDFRTAVATHRETLAEAAPEDARAAVAALTDDETARTALRADAVADDGLVARYVALRDRVDDLDPERALALAVVTGQVERGTPRSGGAPDGFLPVGGDDLVDLVALYRRCIVYAWREGCAPCDQTREHFDALFADGPPEDVMCLSVYGPDCPRLLSEEFDVVGAPTTLFTLEGEVDARLVGLPAREAVESEVETLRERSLSSV
jgi:thiol-disulfide isomerase/thioredoxin